MAAKIYIAKEETSQEILEEVKKQSAGGLAPKNMIQFQAQPMDGASKIRWQAGNTVIDGQTLVEVKGIMIRRSEDDYPVDISSGELVLNTEDLEGSYVDAGLTNGTTYYYTAFPYSGNGVYNLNGGIRVLLSHPNRSKVTVVAHKLYGFKRAKTNTNPQTRIVYTDMAAGMQKAILNSSTGEVDLNDWADAWFVTGNRPCMMKYDGTIDYYLDPSDYSKKEDGTASDIANESYEGNAMALIPTVWVKRWSDDNYDYTQISNIQVDDDFKAYAHQREDGTVMDWFARSIYDATVINNVARSLSGYTPSNTVAGNLQLQYAQANGDLWESDTWSRVALIWDLLTLMSCSDDVQASWGYGYYTGMSEAAHLKKSGTGDTKGQFYGKAANEVVKVFHFENFWGNIWKLMQGFLTDSKVRPLIKMTRPYSSAGEGYHLINKVLGGTNGGYQSAHYNSEYGLIPITASGSQTTYIPDGLWFAANCFARFGSYGYDGFLVGRAVSVNHALSYSIWNFGVALTCEQPSVA